MNILYHLLLLLLLPTVSALYAEDAGQLDFLLSTGGGPLEQAAVVNNSANGTTAWLLVSTSADYVTARSVTTGTVAWRRRKQKLDDSLWVSSSHTIVDQGTSMWKTSTGHLLLSLKGGGDEKKTVEQVLGDSTDKKRIENLKFSSSSSDCRLQISDDGAVVSAGRVWRSAEPKVRLAPLDKDCRYVLVVSLVSTTVLEFVDKSEWRTAWSHQEDLVDAQNAILVDASHRVSSQEDSNSRTSVESVWHWKQRWQAQARDLVEMGMNLKALASGSTAVDDDYRRHLFGFCQIAVVQTSRMMYGISTFGKDAGQVRYRISLGENKDASAQSWLVRGDAAKGSHHHHRHVRVVTSSNGKVEWWCVNAISGTVLATGAQDVDANVVQTLAVAGEGECLQGTGVVLENGKVVYLPGTQSQSDLFTHVLERETPPSLSTYRVVAGDKTIPVGRAVWGRNERVVHVAYPSRDEIVPSPAHVTGDESLLLKYRNPHLAVVITVQDETVKKDDFSDAVLEKSVNRQSVGAGVDPPPVEEPNLFVNLVDTVSGRLLHRASHANAALSPLPHAVVSENWIFYSFVNRKTRRAELGVLSLFEGKINRKDMNLFHTPERATTFSSLDGRQTQPVVLAKTYSIATPVTAMGVTATRGGISNRKLILALQDGQVLTIDRKPLDPRRPMGQVKEAEKKEGLRQYSEFVPFVTFFSLSYTQIVEGVTAVVSAPTDLESQSLVLAYGGPDLFFARTSPSKGFDLLPDSFSRALLTVVTIGLMMVLVVVQRMAKKKQLDLAWV